MSNENEKKSVPSYAELQIQNEDEYLKRISSQLSESKTESQYVKEFLDLVNKPCPDAWLKKVDVGGGRKISYLPIDKVEFMLTRIFGIDWWREILREQVMLNTVCSTVRLHYKIPGTNIWCQQDGAGGSPIKVNAGQQASNLSEIKANSVQSSFPSSVSYALSNAAERIGDLFGKRLNKDDSEQFQGTYEDDRNATQQSAQTPQQPAQAIETTQSVKESSVTIIMPNEIPKPIQTNDNTKANGEVKKQFSLKF